MDRRMKLDELIGTTLIEAVNTWTTLYIHEPAPSEFIVTKDVVLNGKTAIVKVIRHGLIQYYCPKAQYFVSIPEN